MCGRFTLATNEQELRTQFDLSTSVPVHPTYNAAPGMFLPIILRKSPNRAVLARWGLIPHWAKDPRIAYKLINARSEGIQHKPAFRHAFTHQRCLVPTTGFYEWKHMGKEKIPYFIYLKNQKIFAFAGLYEEWKDAEGKPLLTFTIITTTPNTVVASIHDRMPVILEEEAADTWLDPSVTDVNVLLGLLHPYSARSMSTHTVSPLVNNPEHDAKELIAPRSS